MQIGKNIVEHKYHIESNGTNFELDSVQNIKDLGIIFDSKLNFEMHMDEKINKANSLMGIIRRGYSYLNIVNFVPLYKAMVRSYFDYASTIWYPLKKEYVNLVEGTQRRATSLVPELKHLSYEGRLRKLNLPSLVYRRLRGDLLEIFKLTHGMYNIDPSTIIKYRKQSELRTGLRGHDHMIDIMYIKSKSKKHFLPNRTAKLWNSLPIRVVNALNLNQFKNNLDKLWINQEVLFDFTRDIDPSLYNTYQ